MDKTTVNKKNMNVLDLNAEEAFNFFMKADQYHGFELPEYFDFSPLLDFVKKKVGETPCSDCINSNLPGNQDGVSLEIMLNKDGKYAVRPLILVNPYLYYFLVREICSDTNWGNIKSCFEQFSVDHIVASSLPVIPAKKEQFHAATTILNWWNSLEQRSLELSLKYRYMFVSDITNCYGTINPQSIDWALSLMGTEHETDKNHALANDMMKYLAAMQHGRNMGIPQGSAIFDFIAEIILGYGDLLLKKRLDDKNITNYEVLRYRDDYRIFCDDKDTLEEISYVLQEVLESLNFRMNSQKTKITDSVVTDSIKSDKLYYIENTPIFNKKGCDFDGFQKHLLYILLFSRKHPNAGQLKNMLSDLDKRIQLRIEGKKNKGVTVKFEGDKVEVEDEYIIKPKKILESIPPMIAIATQIAVENVSVSHYALIIISRLINTVKEETKRHELMDLVRNRLSQQHNSSFNQLWLQNMTYQYDKQTGNAPYQMPLCRLAMGEKINIWNNDWLKNELVAGLPYDSICDKEKLKELSPVVTFKERRAYYEDAPDIDDVDIDSSEDFDK